MRIAANSDEVKHLRRKIAQTKLNRERAHQVQSKQNQKIQDIVSQVFWVDVAE